MKCDCSLQAYVAAQCFGGSSSTLRYTMVTSESYRDMERRQCQTQTFVICEGTGLFSHEYPEIHMLIFVIGTCHYYLIIVFG